MSGAVVRQGTVSLAAEFDIHRFELPAFVVANDGHTVAINRKLAEYLGSNSDNAEVELSFQELQECLGTVLQRKVERVVSSGVSCRISDVVFTRFSGGCRRTDIILSHCTAADHAPGCLGLLIDSTGSWILERKQSAIENELSIVSQVSAQLGSTLETDEIVKIILIAVTAREGLGFNRAFLMLIDDSHRELRGHHAIGPVDAEEAGRIWGSIPDEGKNLKSVISSYIRNIRFDETACDRAIRHLVLPLSDAGNPISRVAFGRTPVLIDDSEALQFVRAISGGLSGDSEIAVAPLNAKESVLGLIVADNKITGREIRESDIDQLQMFANQAGLALERSRLYKSLQTNIEELENVNLELERTHREIVQIERLSLMGEMTYKITHELRNPLTIIGGFASLLLRSKEIPDSERERAEIIWTECRRVEQHLDALLDFSKSYSGGEDDVDFSRLLSDVVSMVQSKFTQAKNSLCYKDSGTEALLRVRRDLLMHGMFRLFELLSEIAGPGIEWEVTCINGPCEIRAELYVTSSRMSHDESTDLLRRFVERRTSMSDLRLSLANEAIAYDGGELGFEILDNRPTLYVAFSRQENADGQANSDRR
jgi:GAF domain-containing protein